MPHDIKRVEIDAATKQEWTKTRAALMWRVPAFSYLLLRTLNPAREGHAAFFTTDVPVAATDGKRTIINPETFFKNYDTEGQVFILGHEVLHNALHHPEIMQTCGRLGYVPLPNGKKLKFDPQIMNIALDHIINDMLVVSKIGKKPDDAWHNTAVGCHTDSYVTVYERLLKSPPPNKDGGSGGTGGSEDTQPGKGGGFDILLPGDAIDDEVGAAPRASAGEWRAATAAALTVAKLQGNLPAELERALGETLEPQVAWQDKIRALFARRVGLGGYDLRRFYRPLVHRDIYTPGRASFGCELVAVAVDTSGSIGQRELDSFFAEMTAIIADVRPRRMLVIWCDAKVHRVDDIGPHDDVSTLQPVGGGGTSFRPPFQYLEEEGLAPDALVYLTDGYGSFPTEPPSYPVVWGDISGIVTYPFGDVVAIDLSARE